MVTKVEPQIELGEGISSDEPLRNLPPFILPARANVLSLSENQISSIEPTLPSTMLIGALRDPRLRLLAPLTITFERENNNIIAYCEELEEFGFGTHLTEAIADLQATIAEAYFILKEENKRLGSNLRKLWDSLRQRVKEVS